MKTNNEIPEEEKNNRVFFKTEHLKYNKPIKKQSFDEMKTKAKKKELNESAETNKAYAQTRQKRHISTFFKFLYYVCVLNEFHMRHFHSFENFI